MKGKIVFSALLALVAFSAGGEAIRVRCGLLSFLPKDFACRSSCWAKWEKTGECDDDGNCVCAGESLDLFEGKNIFDYAKEKFGEFKRTLKESGLADDLKSIAPSRCRISES